MADCPSGSEYLEYSTVLERAGRALLKCEWLTLSRHERWVARLDFFDAQFHDKGDEKTAVDAKVSEMEAQEREVRQWLADQGLTPEVRGDKYYYRRADIEAALSRLSQPDDTAATAKRDRHTQVSRPALPDHNRDVTRPTGGQFDGSANEVAPPRRAGRPPEWDWQGAMAHLTAVANTADGLPAVQADAERMVEKYFCDRNDGNSPTISAIRERVRPVYRAIAEMQREREQRRKPTGRP